jgi:hypothetical protein
MKNRNNILGAYILGSAIVWGATLIGIALKLRNTDCYEQISLILIGGAAIHLIFIWGPLAAQLKKHSK